MRKMLAIVVAAAVLGAAVAAHAEWVWSPQTKRFINTKRLPKETAELQIEYARSLMLEGDYKKAIRETDKFTEFYGDSELADGNQFLRGEIRMRQGELVDAAKEFQMVVANYPGSDLFDEAVGMQYQIGDQLFERGEQKLAKKWKPFRKRPFKQAIEVYSMGIENQPFTEGAAEAQYKIGLAYFTRGDYIEAGHEYRVVIEEYGNSEWVDEASYGLAVTYAKSSLPPEYDQSPSQLTVDAIDEFEARFPQDSRNEELAEVRQEMIGRIAAHKLLIARFYEKRRKFDSARIYYQVVVEQYPDTEAASTAREWLSKYEGGQSMAANAAPEAQTL
jgi:outer membrane assembly lipoprotein YfiO